MVSGLTNSDSLRSDQYKDSSNLAARAELHQRFSTNPTGWHEWVFNQFVLPDTASILELGSGPGYLWQYNRSRLQKDMDICLADISEGMLQEAHINLTGCENIRYAVSDICKIPFPENTFSAVIANHMLYHVSDLPAALKEIKRVLKPGFCLYAATNGVSHLYEIRDWKTKFYPDQEGDDWGTAALGFSVENGAGLLQSEFSDIRFQKYPDSLLVDQIEPLINYIKSYTKLEDDACGTKQLRDYLQDQISKNGAIQITKESGVFVALKR